LVTPSIFFLILGMAVVTYVTRGPVLALAGRLRMPAFIRCCLEVAPGAAMATLTVSFVIYPGGEFAGIGSNAAVYAVLVTLAAAYYLRNIALIAPVGVAALNFFRWIMG
jgi:branched-subunit amino acid transport protein